MMHDLSALTSIWKWTILISWILALCFGFVGGGPVEWYLFDHNIVRDAAQLGITEVESHFNDCLILLNIRYQL